MPIPYLEPFTPAYLVRPRPRPRVRNDTHDGNFFGSSSTSGGQLEASGNAVTRSRAPADWVGMFTLPGSKVLYNYGVGGVDEAGAQTQMSGAANKAAVAVIQCDLQDGGINKNGGGHGRMAWLRNTVWDLDAGGASPLLDASVYSNRRWCAWLGTNAPRAGGIGWWNDSRFQRLAWAEFPGLVINEVRYWQFAPSNGGPRDDADKGVMQQPSSLMIADRSHRHDNGYRFTTEAWVLDFWEANQGGLPFFADHRYDVTASTCQTNGGAVVTLAFVGSLTGCTLSLLRADRSPHPDFAINSSTAAITRATGTLITRPQDIFLEVRRGDQVKVYHLELNLSRLTTAPGLSVLDGNFGLTLYSNDNAGSLYAPSYDPANARLFAGLSTGQTEGAVILALRPDVDGVDMFAFAAGPFIRRISTNAWRASAVSDGGTAFGQTSTAAVGTAANGLVYVCYSFSCANNRQQFLVWRDSTAAIIGTGSVTTIGSQTTGQLNPIAFTGVSYNAGFMAGGTSDASLNTWVGGYGLSWACNKEIDWSNSANLALFRSGVGTFVDRGADGSLTIAAGVNAGVSVTPYHYINGQPDEMYKGFNRGTGGDWEPWQKRDWRRRNWNQGVPQ